MCKGVNLWNMGGIVASKRTNNTKKEIGHRVTRRLDFLSYDDHVSIQRGENSQKLGVLGFTDEQAQHPKNSVTN